MNKRAFTIVELIVVIAIMGILITLSVVNMRDSQINARDSERKADMEALALQLEIYYTSGSAASTSTGEYPSTIELIGNEPTLLRDLNPNSLNIPGTTTSGLIAATNNITTTSGVTPASTVDSYIYQPIAGDGSLCTLASQECRKFNLYYSFEADGSIYSIQSKNQ